MGIQRRTEQRQVEVVTYVCDHCGDEHAEASTVVVLPWDLSPRTVEEGPDKVPIVTEAVPGDPLVLCRATCIRETAERLRG